MKRLWPVILLVLMVAFLAVPVSAADDGYNGYIDFLPVESDWVTVPAGGYTDVYYYGDPAAGDYYCNILANPQGCVVSSKYETAKGIWAVQGFTCYRVKTDTRNSKFYIRFTNNSDSSITFQIRRCFGGVLSGPVNLDATAFGWVISSNDYFPSNYNLSDKVTQFPSTFTMYTETTQNASYFRYLCLGCDATLFSGLDSVTVRFYRSVTSTGGTISDIGSVKSVEVFNGNSVIPCELSNVTVEELGENSSHFDFYDVTFTPPNTGKVYIRIQISTAYSTLEGPPTVTTYLTIRDIVGRYENTYTLYDFYQQLCADLDISFSELISAIAQYSTELADKLNAQLTLINDNMVGMSQQIIYQIIAFKQDILAKLDEILHSDTSEADEFNQAMEDQVGQIQDANDIMDTVTKPDPDGIDVSVDTYVNQNDIAMVGQFFSIFLTSGIFSQMVMISLILTLVGVVLFGKR